MKDVTIYRIIDNKIVKIIYNKDGITSEILGNAYSKNDFSKKALAIRKEFGHEFFTEKSILDAVFQHYLTHRITEIADEAGIDKSNLFQKKN